MCVCMYLCTMYACIVYIYKRIYYSACILHSVRVRYSLRSRSPVNVMHGRFIGIKYAILLFARFRSNCLIPWQLLYLLHGCSVAFLSSAGGMLFLTNAKSIPTVSVQKLKNTNYSVWLISTSVTR